MDGSSIGNDSKGKVADVGSAWMVGKGRKQGC